MQPVPRIPPLDRPATYDDLVKVSDLVVAEIVDGELYATPRPALRHVRTGSVLGVRIGGPYDSGDGGPGGWWVLDEPELHFGRDVLVPDLAGWRRTHLPRVPDAPYCSVVPDWVCEVLSPSTASLDRTKKLAIYLREQVGHAWLIDPIARTLEVLRIDGSRWTMLATHSAAEVVRAEPFTEVELDLAELWSDAP
jgi:Uma2 family endonuclease